MKPNVLVGAKVRCKLYDVKTHKLVRKTAWEHNLVMDAGLVALAGGTNAARPNIATSTCYVGSGSAANSFGGSGSGITFTQVGNTLTASSAIFTSNMVNALFKYGVGTAGQEIYITGFTSSTIVTVNVSQTISTPTSGTIWMVNYSALQTNITNTTAYVTTGGACGTSYNPSTGLMTVQRTYQFPVQVGTINVNEIGYSGSTGLVGRIVLGSTVVVPITNFLVVVIAFSLTVMPFQPTSVSNVGTNINTAGNAMIESFTAFGAVNSSGAPTGDSEALDNNCSPRLAFFQSSYSQNGTITISAAGASNPLLISFSGWSYTGTANSTTVGQMECSYSASLSTSGQTLYGIGLYNSSTGNLFFDVLFTTPFVTPNGTFLPEATFSVNFGRTLTNT